MLCVPLRRRDTVSALLGICSLLKAMKYVPGKKQHSDREQSQQTGSAGFEPWKSSFFFFFFLLSFYLLQFCFYIVLCIFVYFLFPKAFFPFFPTSCRQLAVSPKCCARSARFCDSRVSSIIEVAALHRSVLQRIRELFSGTLVSLTAELSEQR